MPRSRISQGKLRAEVLLDGLVASAYSIPRGVSEAPRKIKRQEWQEKAWFWYDTIEVFHYGVTWVGNTLSRAKLFPAQNGKLTANQVAVDALNAFFGGPDQHPEFLRQAAVHMTVAGEGYIVGEEGDGGDEWQVAAATEVKNTPTGYKVDEDELGPNSLVIRFWRPHPRKHSQSDSPTRPLLPILSQIDDLTQYVSAQLDSRLTGNGLLLLPSEVSFPTPVTDPENGTQQTGLEVFMAQVQDAMAAAKKDRTLASARNPIGLQVPGEFLKDVTHLTFWTELDESAESLRKEAIGRLALGMDMPPEALTGVGESNHWSAWQIEDSLIKSHSEPLLRLITSALTVGYFRPLLIAEGLSEEEAATFEVLADTADMRLRPDRSEASIELWDRGELSGAAMRRETGFTEEDGMSEDEKKSWIIWKLAQGSPSPELVQAAADKLGLGLDVPADSAPSGERPLPRSLEEHPARDIPDTRDANAAALLAYADAAVNRVLERVGNRSKTVKPELPVPEGVAAIDRYQFVTMSKTQLDFVLKDAWQNLDRLSLPDGTPLGVFQAHLDNYVRVLLSSRQPHDIGLLSTYLDRVRRAA